MKKLLLFSQILVLLCLSLSCQDSPTAIGLPPPDVRSLRNIPFVLTEVRTGNISLNLGDYEPFHFLTGDSTIFGDDGCNHYWGGFTFEAPFFFVRNATRTLGGCRATKPQISPCELIRQWSLASYSNVIILRSGDTSLAFTSSYMKSALDFPGTGKSWRLCFSSDTAYRFLNSRGLILTLSFTATRQFELRYYYPPESDSSSADTETGYFGIGDRSSICLYIWGGGYNNFVHPWTGFRDVLFVNRLLQSNSYSYSSQTLTIRNSLTGVFSSFTLDPG